MKLSRYCACGSALTGRVTPDRIADRLLDAWDKTHNEPGCAPATPEQARAARRRNERAEAATPEQARAARRRNERAWRAERT